MKYNFEEMDVNHSCMNNFLGGAIDQVDLAFWGDATPQGGDFWREVERSGYVDGGTLRELRKQYNEWLYPTTKEETQASVAGVKAIFYDPVDKPAHYNQGGVECIDYIRQVLGLDGFIAYCHGNMIMYQHRYRYKENPREDMKKAQWYLNKMNEALEEKYK